MMFTFATRDDAIDHVVTRVEQQGGNPNLYCIESYILDMATELYPHPVVDIPPGKLVEQLEPYAHKTARWEVDLFSGTTMLLNEDREEILSVHLPEIQALRSALLAEWDAWGGSVDPSKIRIYGPFRAHTVIKDTAS